MVELKHNNHRYMVENGQWFRRLEVGEVVNFVNEMRSTLDGKWQQCCSLIGGIVSSCEVNDYRVPCTDPRPPFVVGQRVKVARRDREWEHWVDSLESLVGVTSTFYDMSTDGGVLIDGWSVPYWCLDAVTEAYHQTISHNSTKQA